MTGDASEGFASYLLRRHHVAKDLGPRLEGAEGQDGQLPKLWELTELSAGEFADEVAQFSGWPRAGLPHLLPAPALFEHFPRRFLRDMPAFPYRGADGAPRLALADPTDTACIRAAEIVLGGPIAVEEASFEDIATVLAERLGDDNAPSDAGTQAYAHAQDDDIAT